MAGSHPSAVSKGAPQEGQGKEDRVPGKRGVTASVNSTAIFGARHAHSGRGRDGGVLPSVATGTGRRLISLPCGKSLED